jgi:hypothetical protein
LILPIKTKVYFFTSCRVAIVYPVPLTAIAATKKIVGRRAQLRVAHGVTLSLPL